MEWKGVEWTGETEWSGVKWLGMAWRGYLPIIHRGIESTPLAASPEEDDDEDVNGVPAGKGTSRVPYMNPGRST